MLDRKDIVRYTTMSILEEEVMNDPLVNGIVAIVLLLVGVRLCVGLLPGFGQKMVRGIMQGILNIMIPGKKKKKGQGN